LPHQRQKYSVAANAVAQPAVASFPDNGFVSAWTSQNQDGSKRGIYAQGYTSSGKATDAESLVNTTISKDQLAAAGCSFCPGKFVVVWTSRERRIARGRLRPVVASDEYRT
jgi:hypothetical protein